MLRKKGQSGGGAAVLLTLIALLIVLYVLFLPPEAREELLSDNPYTDSTGNYGSSTGSNFNKNKVGSFGEFFLRENPGYLEYHSSDEIRHSLNPLQLYSSEESEVIFSRDSIELKKSWFSENSFSYDLNFATEAEFEKVNDLVINYRADVAVGNLLVYLNNNAISQNLGDKNPSPIKLTKENLQQNNKLVFELVGPEWQFWKSQKFIIKDLSVIAKIFDDSSTSLDVPFEMSAGELSKMDDVVLQFNPSCLTEEYGTLTIKINDIQVYSQVPSCTGETVPLIISDHVIDGENVLSFDVSKGKYIISQIAVVSQLQDLENPSYYFEIDDSFFYERQANENRCGLIDGYCPDNCDDDIDYDCCFEDRNNFWCDVEPDEFDDRCVSIVTATTNNRCASGYEDYGGEVHENFEGLCGDDNDNYCPSGCSIYYDKDCCFDENRFWCDEVPITGLDSVCEVTVSEAECNDCASGYKGVHDNPDCSNVAVYVDDNDFENELKSDYDVVMKLRFADKSYKKIEMIINGHKTNVDTYDEVYDRIIDDYLEPGFNSIKIIQKNDVEISSLEIYLD